MPINISESIHDLTDMMVCGREKREWMLHRCENSPGIDSMLKNRRETVTKQHLGAEASEDDKKSFLNEAELKFGQ